ncbi:uncharacterized protein JN550_002132 [Neoarthrinium moseri]|uniref:uncharacterized protein n=1 Tax=Neoarthrinium moseri TaxID=1658444 RepID=UPI001FDCD87D|nr:uncharacterized protein JN550_002132 [Neoarthrinium moseri]KAI1875846.1 hypothetical protein JN550_002132 [Neoarthrinium moseri]
MAAGLGQVISWYICTAVAVVFAGGRQLNQWRRFRKFTIEDGCLMLASCCLVADLIIQQYMWNRGMADMSNATRDDFIAIMQMIVPGSIFYVTSLWAVKFALTLLYKKIAAPGTKIQIVFNIMLGFLAATWLVIFFHIIFQCYPHDKRWSLDPEYQCSQESATVNYWITILTNIFADVIIICLPVSMVLKLQMKLKQKLGVLAIFALGIFVVISSIVRAYYSKRNETMLTCTVSMVETSIAIVAASLPALRSLVLGRSSQAANSYYGGHYELPSANRQAQSRIVTNIVGGSRRGQNDSEDELVKENRSAVSGERGKSIDSNSGIRVNTTLQMEHGPGQAKFRAT